MYRTALARRHRPRRFSELVGQDHVAGTLRAAVEGGRVAHAYLFCGPRGIGKTTAARVLAMALNCPNREGGEPCGRCESCESIWSGRTSLDVVEIDAASNRGVDDARDLRERAMYAPSDESRYKVYIVDEAHMLTREAWNALLKILEEPPPRVIFAFATTEPQKIRQSAAPVLSRCQRFDFRRVAVSDLMRRLRQVVEAEGVEADDAALRPIARRAEGGVRDALSLLDQVLSFAGDHVGLDDVRRMLGLVEEERYLELLQLLAAGDRAAVFPFVQGLLDAGYDLQEFVRGLGEALRLALALRFDPEAGGAELGEESRAALAEAAAAFQPEDLLRMLVAVAEFEAEGHARRSAHPRIQVEVLLLRLASLEAAVRLEELFELLGGGETPPGGRDESRRARPRRESVRTAPRPERKAADTGSDSGTAEPAASTGEDGDASGRVASPPTEPADEASEPAASEAGTSETPAAQGGESDPREPEGPGGTAAEARAVWEAALAAARERGGLGGEAVGLMAARLEGIDGGVVELRVPPGLAEDLQRVLDDRRRCSALRRELCDRLEVSPESLEFRVSDSGPRRRLTAEAARDQRLQRLMEADPRLREAVETLDLTLEE